MNTLVINSPGPHVYLNQVFDGATPLVQMGVLPSDHNCGDNKFFGCAFQNADRLADFINTQSVLNLFSGCTALAIKDCLFNVLNGGNLTILEMGVAGAGPVVLRLHGTAGGDNCVNFRMVGVRAEWSGLVECLDDGDNRKTVVFDGCQQAVSIPGSNPDYSKYPPAIIAAGQTRIIARDCLLNGPVHRKGNAVVELHSCELRLGLDNKPLVDPGVKLFGCFDVYWRRPIKDVLS